MAKVLLKNVTKKFGKVIAINRLSMEVKDKEFVVLLGPSGSGKTTALRCIAGLENPDEGEIYIGGRLVNDLSPKDRNVAMVFQNYALYPHMTVYDNIAFPLKMRKYPKTEIYKKVREVSKLLKIEELLKRKPKQLSGGQQQRVALARGLVREPEVFLMDEPLSNLDAKLRVYMRAELKKMQKELGITTIYVTHDQVEAMTMADRIAVINSGTLQQYATPDEIYNHPSNIFVAGFIGSPPMNFLEASFKEEVYLDLGFFKYKLDNELAKVIKENSESSELILGIRPEHIEMHFTKVEGGIKGQVYVVEPLGGEMIINVKVGDNIVKIKQIITTIPEIGETVWLTWHKEKMHIFDKKTGKVLI